MVQENLTEHRVTGVRLTLLSNKEKQALKVKELTNPLSFDNLQNPSRGGVYDPALGCFGNGECETCGLPFTPISCYKYNTCPGHFGAIRFPVPVFNPYAFDFFLRLLKCVCLRCASLQKRESECILFVKQMEAIKLSLFDLVDKMANIHSSYEEQFKKEFQSKLPEFLDELDLCIKSGLAGQNCREPINSKSVLCIEKELCMAFMEKSKRCSKCKTEQPTIKVDRQQGIINIGKGGKEDDGETRPPILLAHEARDIFRKLWGNCADILRKLCSTCGVESTQLGHTVVKREVDATTSDKECPMDVFFMSYLLVMPPRSRPPNYMNGMLLEHGMSTHYCYIIQASNNLRNLMSAPKEKNVPKADIFDGITKLQMRVNAHVDKSMCKMLKDAPEGIKQLLERKEGLMRWNVMGKRVNHAARSVISPDPNIPCDKVGVPLDIAKKLYIMEPVTARNIEEMRKAVINGTNTYPGAISVTMENGSVVSLFTKDEHQREAFSNRLLTPPTTAGNINKCKMVKRHMKDGDMMILNRQPTLHKPSMQGFQVKVMSGSRTLKINYSACKAFNADFDGDEMNAHLPQDLVSRSEALNIVSSTEQFLVPKDGKPIGGLIQDHIVGGMMMTMKGVFFTEDKYHEIVFAALCPQQERIKLLPPSMVTPYRMWSGKEVVSTIILNLIPSNKTPITMEGNTKISEMDWRSNQKVKPTKFVHLAEVATKTKVLIYNGVMHSGLLDKSQIGASANGLLHYCYELYGGKMVSNLMSCFARLFTNFLQYQAAFSMGMDDVEFTKQGAKNRKKCIRKIQKIGSGVMARALNRETADEEELRNLYRKAIFSEDKDDIRIVDASFQNIMNEHQEEIKKSCWPHLLVRTFPHNGLLASVISGAKGSPVNCFQISCLLGQVDLEGSRPSAMVSGKTFALFKPFDVTPEAGGFVFGSFCSGLKQSEFFFHCMAGRDGLIDTAVKTSRSGYLQRCLVKLLEGIKIGYDGSVRDHDGTIIQAIYGGDGLDIMKSSLLSKKHFTHLLVNREAILSQDQITEITNKVDKSKSEKLNEEAEEWNERNSDGKGKNLYDIFVEKYADKAWDHLEHLDIPIWKKKSMCSQLLSEMFEKISKKKRARLEGKLDPCLNPVISTLNPAMYLGCTSENFRKDVQSYLKGEFKKSQLIKYGKKKITDKQAEDFFNILYQRALINPGEPVGLLAATSIGEQTTQMTLNTFHFAGQNAMNVTLGVPRLREILMTASKNIKTPQITVPLKSIDPELEAKVERIAASFRKIPLDKVMQSFKIKESLQQGEQSQKAKLSLKIKLSVKDPNIYKKEYNIKPKEILDYLETKFIKRFIDKIKIKSYRKENDKKTVIRKKHVKEFVTKLDKEDEDGGEREAVFEDDDDRMSNFSDDDDDDDTRRQKNSKRRGDDDEEKSSEEEDDDDDDDKKTKKMASDDEDDSDGDHIHSDDEDDDDVGSTTELRKRKIKTENGKIVFVEEVERTNSAKRAKIEVDDGDKRILEMMERSKSIKSYQYDTQKNMWCIVDIRIDSDQFTHDMLEKEIRKSYITQIKDFTNCIMKSIDKDDSPLYMFESAEKMRAELGLGPESRRKKIVIEGKNIMELLKYEDLLSLDEMYCNDIHLVADTFSINVAKKIIIEEIRQVFKAYNIDLDFRHLNLIADYMSFQGIVMPFNRYGINSSTSIFQKASFETALNFVRDSAINTLYDTLECPSSSIAVGKQMSAGTGSFELRMPLR